MNRKPLRLLESADHLSDAKMKSMLPLFVRGKPGDSHNCGTCSMFIAGGECTVVSGSINGDRGSCAYWAEADDGPAAKKDKKPVRMTKSEADYVEPKVKINCSTCKFVSGSHCKLWDGSVSPGDCCMAWHGN